MQHVRQQFDQWIGPRPDNVNNVVHRMALRLIGAQSPQEDLLTSESQPAADNELFSYEWQDFDTPPPTPPQGQVNW